MTNPTSSKKRARARCAAGVLAALLGLAVAQEPDFSTTEPVGRKPSGELATPANQLVTPLGVQIDLPGMRPQAVALSPNGSIAATAGKTSDLVLFDPATGEIRQRVPLPGENSRPDRPADEAGPFDPKGQISFTGLVFSPDGRRIYLSNVNGSVKVFGVEDDLAVRPLFSIPLPNADAPRRREEIPAGLAVSADGARLYVALNLSNRLAEIDPVAGEVLRTWDVGVAPYGVALAGGKAYVTNWGGRRPGPDDVVGPAGKGTLVRVDPVRFIANDGSVSVVDLAENRVRKEILVGLHPSGLALSPDGKHLVVTNAASDTVSVVDVQNDALVETIWTKENPAVLFGASPNAAAFDPSGRWLYVCNGTMNAVAVIEFQPGRSELEGMIPVGWFPGAVEYDPVRKRLVVANIKGLGPGRPNEQTGKIEHNTHQYYGSLSLVEAPDKEGLRKATAKVMLNCRMPAVQAATRPPRPDQPPRPVPERTGEPSLFEHVIYVIKENRTYDQILGDMPQGNGEPSLCIFGEKVTPNQHRIAAEFVLLDNTYCSGILSADGHQWSDSAFATDYMEKSFAGFPRSYPDGMDDDDVDALAYAPSGFIWDNAIKHGKSLRVYGEFAIAETSWKDKNRKDKPNFLDHYRDFVNQTGLIDVRSRPAVESLAPYLCTSTVGWDMDVPDVFRAAQFIRELEQFEREGKFPNLVIICLPNDHTSGTKAGSPTPAAQVADNDLAFGRIVEAVSRSKFWRKTCILAIEDDPQAGWDHVSGYRTTAYVVSPYTKRRTVVSTQYNQTSLLRTIELMLGLPPMNIMDASASPMRDCFTSTPDFTPYEAAPNQVPLDEMNPEPAAIDDPLLRSYAEASAGLPLEKIDQCPEDLLNRILWHAQKGSDSPYPEWAVTAHDDDD
jgi:YVTN family beta-propeller protein